MTPYARKHKADRDAWRDSMPQRCMWCGKRWRLEIHEIERRSHATNNWWPESGSNGLLLCRSCHEGPFATMPHAQQLALKLVADPEHFDLEEWLSLKPRHSSYVTLADIAKHLSVNRHLKQGE